MNEIEKIISDKLEEARASILEAIVKLRYDHPKGEVEKPEWEKAWEKNEPFSLPNTNQRVLQWKQMFKAGYEAAKGNEQ